MAMQVSELTPIPTDPVDTRFRRIATPIPVPESLPAIERLRAVEPQSMAGLPPIIWHRAQGFQVEDPYGNRWIDLTSGAAAANAGHGHPRIIQAVKEQLDAELLFTYAFPSQVRARLIERIAGLPPRELDKAIAFCSGNRGQRVHADPDAPARAVDLARQDRHPVVQRHLLRAHPGGAIRRRQRRARSTRSGASGCSRPSFRCPGAPSRADSGPIWPTTGWTR